VDDVIPLPELKHLLGELRGLLLNVVKAVLVNTVEVPKLSQDQNLVQRGIEIIQTFFFIGFFHLLLLLLIFLGVLLELVVLLVVVFVVIILFSGIEL